MGLVRHVFNSDAISKLRGFVGIGHTRYSTSAKSEHINCQPFVVHSMHGSLAVAHNGELVNASSLRTQVHFLFCFICCHSDHVVDIAIIILLQRHEANYHSVGKIQIKLP